MHWMIEHTLIYHYSMPVALDSQVICLKPRSDIRQRVNNFDLDISPLPSFKTDYEDSENNERTIAWFQGTHETFRIVARSDAETNDTNPYDFILTDPTLANLPLDYKEPDKSLLSVYIRADKETSPVLRDFLEPVLTRINHETVPFITELTAHIFNVLKRRERKSGNPWDPETTLKEGKGACRDLAWLYIAACRSLGLAARFVSGYYVPDKNRGRQELHAWAEVFLPGVGWIGFDPSLGLAVSQRHIAIASSFDPALTLPITGKLWGKKVKSDLKTTLKIRS